MSNVDSTVEDDGLDDDFDFLLNNFITEQLSDIEDRQEEIVEVIKDNKPLRPVVESESELLDFLYPEEKSLYDAFVSFMGAIRYMAEQAEHPEPVFQFTAELLYSRFRPKKCRVMCDDITLCWDIMLEIQKNRLANLSISASDEEILEFAEKVTDENLQIALISYVEILIELEGCELSYNLRKAKFKKRKIEKEIYDSYQLQAEKKKLFIDAIRKQDFPIDAEKLISTYFKNAKKDPDGAYQILTTSPATFSPIQISKLKSRLFGLIKPKPEDGIKVNKEIGEFLRKLKA